MPVDQSMVEAAVLIRSAGQPLGSGFLLSVPSEQYPDREWRYVVSADHVVRNRIEREVVLANPLAEIPGDRDTWYDPMPLDDWEQPIDGVDLAIAPLLSVPPEKELRVSTVAEAMMPHGQRTRLGGTIYYIGLFSRLGVMMVRSGTLGAINVHIRDQRYSYNGYLVDCRSYEGFSGSMCLGELTYTRSDKNVEPPLGPLAREQLRDFGGEMPTFHEPWHLSRICGLFTAHFDEERQRGGPVSHLGVGVMVPHRYIWDALMSEKAKQQRREWDAIADQMERQKGPQLRPASLQPQTQPESEFERFEDLTRKLINTPKPDVDD